MAVSKILGILEIAGFIGAQFTNSLLLYLLYMKSDRRFKKFKHLMAVFAVFDMIYSWIEVVLTPVMHIKGPGMIAFVDSFLKYDRWIANDLITLYCALFATCISLLALQFGYRYIAVCRPHQLDSYFSGYKFILMFIPSIILTIIWFLIEKYLSNPTPAKEAFFKSDFHKYYNENISELSFVAVNYKFEETNGQWKWNWDEMIGAIGCDIIMFVCFQFILFCGVKTYRKMTNVSKSMSKKTKELNKQLFLTLVLQTLLPTITMYAPVGLLFTLPIFEIEVGFLANQVGVCLGIYPALDPLVPILLIKDFRRTVLCRKREGYQVTDSRLQSATVGSVSAPE